MMMPKMFAWSPWIGISTLAFLTFAAGCESRSASIPQVQQPARPMSKATVRPDVPARGVRGQQPPRAVQIPAPKSHSVEGIIRALQKDPESEPRYPVWSLALGGLTVKDAYQITCNRGTKVEMAGQARAMSDLRIGQKVKVEYETHSWIPITNDQVGNLKTAHVAKRIVIVKDVQP